MILVTGGTGFVGPKVVRALRDQDRPVRCLVRDSSASSAELLAAWGCELAQGYHLAEPLPPADVATLLGTTEPAPAAAPRPAHEASEPVSAGVAV